MIKFYLALEYHKTSRNDKADHKSSREFSHLYVYVHSAEFAPLPFFFMIFGKIFSLKMSSFIFWWYKVPVLLYLKLMTLSFIICHQNYVCFCTWAAKSLKGTHLNCKLTKLIVLVTDLWQYGGLWKSKSLKSVQKRWFLEYG